VMCLRLDRCHSRSRDLGKYASAWMRRSFVTVFRMLQTDIRELSIQSPSLQSCQSCPKTVHWLLLDSIAYLERYINIFALRIQNIHRGIHASGINPGKVKKRSDAFGIGMPSPRVIPHSDGTGIIDSVGNEISEQRIGERVWCFGAQSYRAFGTAAEYVVIPKSNVAHLPDHVYFFQTYCNLQRRPIQDSPI
jgi:hypothetical protein